MEEQKVTPKVVATVWRHWKGAFGKSKVMIAAMILFYSLAMYVELMYRPTQWKHVFDSLTTGASPWRAFTLIVAASVVAWVINRLADACIVRGETKIIKDLKDYCMEGLLGKNTKFFSSYSSGALVAKSKRFANVSETVIDEFVFSIIRSAFFILYLVIYSWILIPELSGAFIVWTALFITAVIIFSKWRMRYDLVSSKLDSKTTGHISDILLSVLTLRVYSAIPKVTETFREVTKEDYVKRKKAWLFGNFQWATQSALVIILEIYCMNMIITKVESGVYTIGTAVLVQSYIASLTMYMWGLGRSFIKVRTAFADAHEMSELLDVESTEPIAYAGTDRAPLHNGIKFSDVTFGYTDEVHALKNFSFNFLPQRRYGIVGKTGSGKSTLTKLVLRLYEQHSGGIDICNENIKEVHKLALRSWISYVPQDPQFPSWKVKDIIAMGRPHATVEEIREAAEKASCDFIWEKLPKGFDTEIGERGVKLSGGERQRLAIAAAILKDGPIIIMDEPTSALDAETEHSIQKAIQTHFEGKTLIVIAHRLSTVAILDEILMLEDGKVKDFGPHESLLKTSDDYARMWALQTNPHIG